MTKWSETSKALFKWNQYVVIYVDGEKATDTVKVRDTKQYGEYKVDEMFGHNKVTRVMLVTPEADDEIAQAARTVKDAGGMVVLPENRERFDAQLKQLHNAEGACDKALAKVNKLTDAIEDMRYDCDAEVYDKLLEIADILGR